MIDLYERKIDYLRISITDRCNLRCQYCMPNGITPIDMAEILTYEEILRFCQVGVQLGITKLRVTGGEPLVRKGCATLVRQLKAIKGMETVSLTSNGILLEQYGESLKAAGINGVNISLDTTNADLYRQITGKNEFGQVVRGIEKMIALAIPVKLNAVLFSGINDKEWESLIHLAKVYPVDVRFIELMPIGMGKDYQGVSNVVLQNQILQKYPQMQEDLTPRGNGPAVYSQIAGFKGRIGFISAIHSKFCNSCNRLRLTAEGKLKPCLCYGDTIDIRKILRNGTDEELKAGIKAAILKKPLGHCFENSEKITELRQMSKIGG